MLWVRVCAAIFPPSFKELPPVKPRGPSSSGEQLSPTTSLGNDNRSNTPEEFSPLLKYAALFMLHHAVDVEEVVKLGSYMSLQPGMSISFLRYHRFFWVQRDSMCECFQYCPVPSHPLHLAIAHGLEGYVKEFLWVTKKHNEPGSREWDDIFYIETDGISHSRSWNFQTSFPMSLLEFAIHHASKEYNSGSKTRIVALLLEQYSHAYDAEMRVALQFSSAEVVKLLLRDWPDGKIILKSNLIDYDEYLACGLSRRSLSEICPDIFDVGPMWYVARRLNGGFYDDDAELIDLFVRRGEDINAQCGPIGAALHTALLNLWWSTWNSSMGNLLVAKGANINVSGPLGTPLELVWRWANTVHHRKYRRTRPYVDAIGWLIENGAVNNRCDPNGSIPSRERMLSFGAGDWKEVRKSQALYRGDLIEEETNIVGQTANA